MGPHTKGSSKKPETTGFKLKGKDVGDWPKFKIWGQKQRGKKNIFKRVGTI